MTSSNADSVNQAVAELIGAALHGAIYVGRTPDGFDGATKDDVVEFAGRIAELLNGEWRLVRDSSGLLNHGDELVQHAVMHMASQTMWSSVPRDAANPDGWQPLLAVRREAS